MPNKRLLILSLVCALLAVVWVVQNIKHKNELKIAQLNAELAEARLVNQQPTELAEAQLVNQQPEQLVFVGDTLSQVYEVLGSPQIEFPRKGTLVQTYAGYDLVISNQVVTSVSMKPVESAEDRREREYRAKLASTRLQNTYRSLADKDKMTDRAWQERQNRLIQEQREENKRIQAYKERKAKEERAKIYADAIKKWCGCYGHCHH